jgi:hypothetical protein
VHDLAHLLHRQHRQHLDRLNGMDHLMMVHLFRCVVEIVNLVRRRRQDVVMKDVLQILDEQNLDEVLTFQGVLCHFLVNLVDVQVGVELRHLLKMDYFRDVVGVELHCLLRMDYFQDEELALVRLKQLQLVHSHLKPVVLVQMLRLLPLHEMPSGHQDLHRALQLILLRVRDQPLHSFWQRSFLQLPS